MASGRMIPSVAALSRVRVDFPEKSTLTLKWNVVVEFVDVTAVPSDLPNLAAIRAAIAK